VRYLVHLVKEGTEDVSDGMTGMPAAVSDFHRARRKAAAQELIARLKGESLDLVAYEEIRQRLKASSQRDKGLQDIPIDAIVGSVGRYTDFNRHFLPRQEIDAYRWARLKMAATGLQGFPPIEVYKLGDVYFVRDGNHRVSVARELEQTYIHAYVTEIDIEVPITPDLEPDDLILKVEYVEFLRWSGLRKLLPGVELVLTAPGKYPSLKEHINVHRYYMGVEQQRPISLQTAVRHWYETIYRPVVEVIERLGLLRHFPDRTEADLYLWIAEHRAAVEQSLGWGVESAVAAEDLAESYSSKPERVLARVGGKLVQALTPETLGLAAPATGEWREKREVRYGPDPARLFPNILVTLDDKEGGWRALDEAFELARREAGRILGLHIASAQPGQQGVATDHVLRTFQARCQAAGVQGQLAIGSGSIAHEVAMRARWADLVVAPLNHPPGADPIAKLRSGFRTLIVQSPCPVLALPAPLFPLSSVLLAYDGSPKSREAMYVATYLAGSWPDLSLVVLTTHPETEFVTRNLDDARGYLASRGINAEYVGLDRTDVAGAIVDTAAAHGANLIVMGGYGYNPVLEVMLGSAVNDVLRIARYPTLVCH
jgi:nucleotide-binding universal stress UspA family protein